MLVVRESTVPHLAMADAVYFNTSEDVDKGTPIPVPCRGLPELIEWNEEPIDGNRFPNDSA